MKKNSNRKVLFLSVALTLLAVVSCKDSFLTVNPTGQLSDAVLSTNAGLQGLLIGVYQKLHGAQGSFWAGGDNTLFGSIKGGDAYKGSEPSDQGNALPIERFETSTSAPDVAQRYRTLYEGIARANALLALLKTPGAGVTSDAIAQMTAESKMLRGHFYFELKRMFNNTPYVDESMSDADKGKVTNDKDLYPFIEADIKAAYAVLPETQAQIGRLNKWAAACYLAKVYMYENKFTEAKALYDMIIPNGKTSKGDKYALLPSYSGLFDAKNNNNAESIMAIEVAAGSGSNTNSNDFDVLNYPHAATPAAGNLPGGCCGFNNPSIELGNSFRVNAAGLPLLDGSYNTGANQVKSDVGEALWSDYSKPDPFVTDQGLLDPRLDASVGRRNIPYLDWGVHRGGNWIRLPSADGPYSPKKFVFPNAQTGSTTDAGWTTGYATMAHNIIRFADVLLMAAEAEIEVGSLTQALTYTNMVRARAANNSWWVQSLDGKGPAANYKVGLYTAFADKATARTAVRFERKLELSGEGHRFFDLVRWGTADTEINAFFAHDAPILPPLIGGAKFTKGKSEHEPIPQAEIDLVASSGIVLKQNPGY